MKQFLFFCSIVLSVFGLQVNAADIEVKNTSSLNRINEIVEIDASQVDYNLNKDFVLLDSEKKEVAYQVMKNKDGIASSLLFQISIEAGKTKTFKFIKGKASKVKSITSARFVPERKDDFAWENDFAGYRVFGPALANENPSNGFDLWLKRTSELVVDTFYYNELNYKKSYHTDWGNGLDLYKVGHTLGAGGFAPYVNDSLYVGNHFDGYEVLANGPLRSKFKLIYNEFKAGNKVYKAEITISADAGSLMNKTEVKFIGKDEQFSMATGIVLHDEKGNLQKGNDWTAYGEIGISEFGVPSGDFYTAVMIPSDFIQFKQKNNHCLQIVDYNVNETFTYYFGGGWSKWKHPSFADWVSDVELFSAKLKAPLQVN